MKWKKLGNIFTPLGSYPWMHSHAAVPFAEHLSDDTFRIFFTCRDRENRSHTAFIDVDLNNPHKILQISSTPALAPGMLGGFDDSGAMGSWITRHNNIRYLYYQGWNLGVTVPFRNSIGLATSNDGTNFSRYAPGPIVDRSMFEPHFTATPCVLVENEKWLMWYLSCTEWTQTEQGPKHKYHIKYAESADGIHWQRGGHVAIDYADDSEYAISRPCVIHDFDRWRMWYSFRGKEYRIGYAESNDGRVWTRMDSRVGITRSASGWDSEMIEYPFVFDHRGNRYMLYNGNGYGLTGFGLAVLEASALP